VNRSGSLDGVVIVVLSNDVVDLSPIARRLIDAVR